jgi:uncharacterized membrane protein required for colicin V production
MLGGFPLGRIFYHFQRSRTSFLYRLRNGNQPSALRRGPYLYVPELQGRPLHSFSRQGYCFINREMQYLTSDVLTSFHLNWFDLVVVVWLIVGIFRGRKHGMSQELLPLVQWIAIIVVTSLANPPLARLMVRYTGLTLLPCAIFCYVFVACAVYGLLGKLKKKLDDTFQEGDYFGGGEYYLGMTSGIIRFACVLIALLAMMNSRIITKAEREATLKMQKANFEDVRFPTYGEVQNTILLESATGNFVRAYLAQFLITPVNVNDAPTPKKFAAPRAVAKTSSGSSSASSPGSSTSSDGGLKISFNH